LATKKSSKKQTNLLMVGTAKGAFIFTSSDGRKNWNVSGPHFKGIPVFHLAYDKRNEMILAGVNSYQWGPVIVRSFDLGKEWKRSKNQPKFPKKSGLSVKNIWHVEPSSENEPDTIYAGVDPACLFKSDDRGESWTVNEALMNHETRPKWQPGFGGLCLHTIMVNEKEPSKLHIGISAVGTMYSKDGGESWEFRNKNVRADFLPNKYPVYGQCVHKIVRHPSRPDILFQQNHCGQYRSDNGGVDWIDIQGNLPSDFGFPIAIDANEQNKVYVTPLEGGDSRVSPKARFSVWVSENSGKSWDEKRTGLPTPAYFTVLREGMASDQEDPCGVYVGTTTGHLYYSRDQGENWSKVTDALPPILSVSASAA
jgi:hypothetical protein